MLELVPTRVYPRAKKITSVLGLVNPLIYINEWNHLRLGLVIPLIYLKPQ